MENATRCFFLIIIADFGVARMLERSAIAKSFCGKTYDICLAS